VARRPESTHGGGAGPARWRAFLALTSLERGRAEHLRDALAVDDLDVRDRGLALELAMGTERRRITIDAVLLAFAAQGVLPRDPFVRTAARLGTAQLLYLPKIPPHAAVHGTVALLRAQQGFVNGILRRIAGAIEARVADPSRAHTELALPAAADGGPRTLVLPYAGLPDPAANPAAALAVRHGLPEFLMGRWLDAFGSDEGMAIAAASAQAPGVTLRVNPTRGDAAGVIAALAAEGVTVTAEPHPRLLRLGETQGISPFETRAHARGLFSVQDPTALAAAEAVGARPGERILDLCAAPGGKTTAMAEVMAGEGTVFAHDISKVRLDRVREAAARLGLAAVVTLVPTLADAPDRVDAVLVDVPCSNTGVLARRVEVRRRLTPGALVELAGRQVELTRLAVTRVRPGGRVVYSTCSLEREENRGVVGAVLATDPTLRLGLDRLTLPRAQQHDGGYFAVLIKAEDP
jgi:16S rRNA (cytosine967-C5)-methyltransferase